MLIPLKVNGKLRFQVVLTVYQKGLLTKMAVCFSHSRCILLCGCRALTLSWQHVFSLMLRNSVRKFC